MKKFALALSLVAVAGSALLANAGDTSPIPFPSGYRTWYHHRTTVNLPGHAPEANVGIQHVYANELAVEGLKSGYFADGASFVLDRFKYTEADNSRLVLGDRKVIAVMVRNAERYKDTGGWGFEGFKGGDPEQRVVKDNGMNCFVCHIPHKENNFLFSRGL
jgi:hypothetical protein